jgi:hypothetical protein
MKQIFKFFIGSPDGIFIYHAKISHMYPNIY